MLPEVSYSVDILLPSSLFSEIVLEPSGLVVVSFMTFPWASYSNSTVSCMPEPLSVTFLVTCPSALRYSVTAPFLIVVAVIFPLES